MIPVRIDLPDVLSGDTWDGLTIGPVSFNGGQPPHALQSCRLYFRDPKTKALACGFKSDQTEGFGTISIDDPAAWLVSIAAQPLPMSAGTYEWDFETTDAAGTVRTLYGGTIRVRQDVTHD